MEKASNDRLIAIIEDHALICHVINNIYHSIVSGDAMPDYLPVLNDTLVTDELSKICSELTLLRKATDAT